GLLDAGARLVVPAARSHVDLAAENGLDALVEAGVVEGDGAEHVAVVGDRHRLHAQTADLVHELIDVARAVKEAVFGVKVEVDEVLLAPACLHSHSIVEGGLLEISKTMRLM